MNSFASEADLCSAVLESNLLQTMEPPNDENEKNFILPELKGLAGIPDLVMVKAHNSEYDLLFTTISFELKLSDWKRALLQAFKYRAFSHKSYVVMDKAFESRALRHIDMFIKANVGLATVDLNCRLNIIFTPLIAHPYSEQLARKAIMMYKNMMH